jgi:hypothetical protein
MGRGLGTIPAALEGLLMCARLAPLGTLEGLPGGMAVPPSCVAATRVGTGLASTVTPYEDIADYVGSQGNQARGTSP